MPPEAEIAQTQPQTTMSRAVESRSAAAATALAKEQGLHPLSHLLLHLTCPDCSGGKCFSLIFAEHPMAGAGHWFTLFRVCLSRAEDGAQAGAITAPDAPAACTEKLPRAGTGPAGLRQRWQGRQAG